MFKRTKPALILCISALILFGSFGSSAAQPYWAKAYSAFPPAHWYDEAKCVKVVPDTMGGGYIVVGETYRILSASSRDILVLKLDEAGNMKWARRFNDPLNSDERAFACDIVTPDIDTNSPGYVISGFIKPSPSVNHYDMLVMKLNMSGDLLWANKYDFLQYFANATGIKVVEDGPSRGNIIVVGGRHNSSYNYFDDLIIMELNGFGVPILPARIYHIPEGYSGRWAVDVSTGTDIAVAGWITDAQGTDGIAMQVNPANLMSRWIRRYRLINGADSFGDRFRDIKWTFSGELVVTGETETSSGNESEDILAAKLTSGIGGGTVLWLKSTYCKETNDQGYSIDEVGSTGDLLITGYAQCVSTNPDLEVLRLTSSGSLTWAHYLGPSSPDLPNFDTGFSISYDPRTTGFIAAGETRSVFNSSANAPDFLVCKANSLGDIVQGDCFKIDSLSWIDPNFSIVNVDSLPDSLDVQYVKIWLSADTTYAEAYINLTCDPWIKDCDTDNGDIPSNASPTTPCATWWNSPDIYFTMTPHLFRNITINVRNRGADCCYNVNVDLYEAPFVATSTVFPSGTLIGSATIASIPPSGMRSVSFYWHNDMSRNHSLGVVLSSPDDPRISPPWTGSLAQWDNNVAQHNVMNIYRSDPDVGDPIRFYISSPIDTSTYVVDDTTVIAPPSGWTVEYFDSNGVQLQTPFAVSLNKGENMLVNMVVTIPPDAHHGDSALVRIVQYDSTMYSQPEGIVGGIDFPIKVDLYPPSAITDLSASAVGDSDIVEWTPVTIDTTGGPEVVWYYNVYRDTVAGFQPDTSNLVKQAFFDEDTTTQRFQVHLPPEPYGGPYTPPGYFFVRAVDMAGHEAANSNMAIVTAVEDIITPKAFSLAQNYPNPFNPVTEIRYALPNDCLVRLEIFNVLGQRIATLVNKKQKAGFYTVRWDASRTVKVSSGVYFYRLVAGTYTKTRKMVIIK